MPSIQQLVQSIDGRIRELNGELGSLEDARWALVSDGSVPTPTRKPKLGFSRWSQHPPQIEGLPEPSARRG